MTHDVIIDGKEYVLNTQAEHKEGDPINFPMTKKDMEHHMLDLEFAMKRLDEHGYSEWIRLNRIKKAFQHMIDETIKKGNWK